MWATTYPSGQLPDHERMQADLMVRHQIVHNGHYEMEKCLDPVSYTDHVPWETIPYGDEEWVFALARHSVLVSLCHAYLATRREAYKTTLLSVWKDFLDEQPYTEERGKRTWRSLECGIRAEAWLRILELMPGEIPFVSQIEQSLKEHGRLLFDTHGSFHRLSNWGVIGDHGLLLLGLHTDNRLWIETALDRLAEELSLQTLEDGTHWEQSPLYHAHVLHAALDTLLVTGIRKGTLFSATKRLAEGLARSTYDKDHVYPQGDSDLMRVGDLLTLASILFRDRRLYRGWFFENEMDGLVKPSWKARTNSHDTFARASGNSYLRGRRFEVHTHAGPLGSGHGHLDQGHVDIVFDGKLIVGDGGRYTYRDCQERELLKNPVSHNTVFFPTDAASAGSWSYQHLTDTIGNRTAKGAVEMTLRHPAGEITRRRVLLLDNLVLVIDDNYSADKAAIAWHAMPAMAADTTHAGALFLAFAGIDGLSAKPCPMSTMYNQLEQGTCIQGTFHDSALTAFSSKPIALAPLPLFFQGDGLRLSPEFGSAWHIEAGGHAYDIISRRKETIHQVDIVQAGKAEGYGSLLVWDGTQTRRFFA